MEKGRWGLRPVGFVVALCFFIGLAVQGGGSAGDSAERISTDNARPDIIAIDVLKRFGPLERPAVQFLHDAHTEALAKEKKDCLSCHSKEEKYLSPKFKRLMDSDREAVMDIYHRECIGCHMDTAGAGKKSGPLVCAGCHSNKPLYTSSRQPMGFDKSLHFRHSKSQGKKCEVCHHAYDEKNKKLYYAKGEEGTCRYCHRKETEEKRVAMSLAAHLSCIQCHRETLARKKQAGPTQCGGCHDRDAQLGIEKIQELPRMERKQPDFTLLRISKDSLPQPEELRMQPVPFDHKAHETYNDTCRICHHETLKACNTCHTQIGSQEGKWVNIETAMHVKTAEKSCIGCHERSKMKKNCAGCHGWMARASKPADQSCKSCHREFSPEAAPPELQLDEKRLAAMMLNARVPVSETYPEMDIPEKVTIKALSEKYEPVELPHRKIVRKLVSGVQEEPLARFFHREPGTLCQGCHHHSPPAKKPPKCGSCHGKPFDKADLFKPGLMGAYHRQCMECHEQMGIEKPASRDCTGCHIEKRKW